MEVAEIPKDIVSTDISPNSEDRNGGDPTDVVSGEDIVIEKARSEERIGEHDVRKPHSRKDWNTPWIRKDGKGLKKIFRNVHGIDPVAAPVKTSHNHFYSEPHSLLGPEPEPIPLEKLEEMREAISRTHELQRSEKRREEESLRTHRRVDFEEFDPRETGFEIMKQESHEKGSESYCQVEKSQSTFGSQQFEQQQMEMTSPTPVCPEAEFCEGSEPPELEEIYDSHNHIQEGGEGIPSSVSNSENILYDVQEEGSLDHKEEREQQHDHLENLQSYLDLEELKKSMEKFTSMSSGHEPSADELIQVLKNLENLASSNTPMYLALVQLIEANQSNSFNDTMNHMNEDVNLTTNEILNTQEQREDVQCEKKEGEDRSVEEEEEGRGGMPAREMNEDTENNKEEKVPKESSEAEKVQDEVSIIQEQEDISMKKEKDPADLMERIAVKKQEVRRRVHAEPRKIRIVAGSQHRASWPCAPNVTNTTCPKVIEVILGETEEDSFSNRKEVAEKAGLKHIDVIVGDDSFYPQLFEDFEYPWKGSLRPVSDNMHRHESRDFDDEGVPWASSLRHVPDSQKRKKPSKTESTTAPWVGTLRHVKATNNPPKKFTKPQFKRYPDEDAPNPFQSLRGKDARPAYPLTPAAYVNSSSKDGDELAGNANDDVDRIRANLRETRAISNALLRVLMPKLLKEHESKYEPLSFEESQRIMQEILSQKIGTKENEALNDLDLNKEIDEALLGKVEDDLKSAMTAKKKSDGKSKKKKKKVTSPKKVDKPVEAVPAQ